MQEGGRRVEKRKVLRGMRLETLTSPAPRSILTIEVSQEDDRTMREAARLQGLDVLTFIQNAIARAVVEALPSEDTE